MRRYTPIVPTPRLKHLVYRLKADTRLLAKHPEHKAMLEKRIERHKRDIIDYVTSSRFESFLDHYDP